MMPPAESAVSAVDMWLLLTSVERAHRMVPFPRKTPDGEDVEVLMYVLSQEECIAAKATAERYARKLLKDDPKAATRSESGQGYEDILEMRASSELLFRACRKPHDPKSSFFPTPDAVGKHLTTDEVAVLVLQYRRVQMELGPIVNEMSKEEMDAWLELLAKGGSMFPFDRLSLAMRSQLLRYSACLSHGSRTGNSSPGTSPDEPG